MPNSCFVPGCDTGYINMRKRFKLEGKKIPSIFAAPSDPKIFDLWVKTVPYTHRPFGRNDGICEYHFTEECIQRYFRTPLCEADRQNFRRRRKTLKRGSVPTIFTSSIPSTEDDLKRKMPIKHSTEVELIDCDTDETSFDMSVTGSSLCDSSAAGLSATDENLTNRMPHNHYAAKSTHANDIIDLLTSDDSISDSACQETEVVKPLSELKFESISKNIESSCQSDVPVSSDVDIAELSPSESLLSNDSIFDPLPSESDTEKPPNQSSKDCQSTKIQEVPSAVWSLNDLYNYVNSLQSLKDDNFTCCRVKSAVILQQWHSSSYHCIKMIILEENLRPQIFIENKRVCSEELLTLNKISSETKLQSLIALVKKLKVLPKISDFHLESFYNKMIRQN